jgi:hypothetical protein
MLCDAKGEIGCAGLLAAGSLCPTVNVRKTRLSVLACETLDRIFLERLGEIAFRVCNRLAGQMTQKSIAGLPTPSNE